MASRARGEANMFHAKPAAGTQLACIFLLRRSMKKELPFASPVALLGFVPRQVLSFMLAEMSEHHPKIIACFIDVQPGRVAGCKYR